MAFDKTLPLDTDAATTIPAAIRSYKTDIETFFNVEHVFPVDINNPQAIHKLPKGNTASRPAAGNSGRLYINTQTVILQKDSGTAWEDFLTLAFVIPAGTKAPFFQVSAPVGWTQDTGFGNDALLRVVATGNISSGGSWAPVTDSQGYHTHAISLFSSTLVHSNGELVHGDTDSRHLLESGSIANHNFSHSHNATGGTHTHDVSSSWRPAYCDVVIATKD